MDFMTASAARRPPLSPRRRRLFAAILAGALLLAAEGAGALLLRWGVSEEARAHIEALREPGRAHGLFKHRFVPHPYTLYQPAPGLEAQGFRQHNSLGFRGPEVAVPKPPGVYRILCLGGSTTYSLMDDPELAYPRRLEKTLRDMPGLGAAEVVNGGMTYATSAEMLGTLAFRAAGLDSDLVVVNMGGNDIDPFLAPGYRPDYSHWRTGWSPPRSNPFLRLILASRLIRGVYGRVLSNRGLAQPFQFYETTTRWDGSDGGLDWAKNHDSAGFRSNVESMILLAKGRGAKVLLADFIFSPEFDLAGKYPAAAEALRKHCAILDELAEKHGAARLRNWAAAIPPEHYLDRMCHLDAEGERLKAEAFAAAIAPMTGAP